MQFADSHQLLSSRFGAAVLRAEPQAIDPWIEVAGNSLPDICRFLRDEPALRFNLLNCISGVDYFETEEKKAAAKKEKNPPPPLQPHLEVLYHLSSLVSKQRLVLMVSLPRWLDEVPGRLPEVPSVTSIWETANWHEREVFDLMGVRFLGHPDLTRILLPEDWLGYPLRKDYRPPHEYHGIARRVGNAG
jgi:NADH-quinone oxidoreductase subunit C